MLQPDLVGHVRRLQVQRPRLQQLEILRRRAPIRFRRASPTTSSARRSRRPISSTCAGSRHGSAARADDTAFGRRRTAMRAGDGVILLTNGGAKQLALQAELEAIGRHFTLRDRRAQSPRRADQHLAGRRPAQPAARRRATHERLHEHGHRGVCRIEVVRRHVPQRTRRPQRRPAGANGRQKFRFELEAQVAFELPGETGPVAIFDERRRSHGGQRAAGSWRPGRATRRAAARGSTGAIGCSSSSSFIRSACRRASAGSSVANAAARRRLEIERRELQPIRLRIEADAVRDRQAGAARGPRGWPPWDRTGWHRSLRATEQRTDEKSIGRR